MDTDLNPKQELFCHYYTKNRELFGNATLAYAEAYDFDLDSLSKDSVEMDTFIDKEGKVDGTTELSEYNKAYNTCSVNGCKLLRLPKIDARIRELMNELMKDDVVDAELMAIVLHGEKDSDRVAAIKEYNKLKQRILEKVDHTSKGEKIIGINYVIPETNG